VALFSKKTEGCAGQGSVFSKKETDGCANEGYKKCALTNCYPCKNGRGTEASTSSRSFVALPHGS
jgi:hypothetical protein